MNDELSRLLNEGAQLLADITVKGRVTDSDRERVEKHVRRVMNSNSQPRLAA